jgi:hypothetical protein
MKIRYDFVGDKLDLSRFQKQAAREIAQMRELTYDFYVNGYKLHVDISTVDDRTEHQVVINLYELIKDHVYEIKGVKQLMPANDMRFKEIEDISNIFTDSEYAGAFESNSVSETIKCLSKLITIIYKINGLKAFL